MEEVSTSHKLSSGGNTKKERRVSLSLNEKGEGVSQNCYDTITQQYMARTVLITETHKCVVSV